MTHDKELVDVVLSLRKLTSDAEAIVRQAVGIPEGHVFDFTYVGCRWATSTPSLRVITQDAAHGAKSSVELDASCTVIPGVVTMILCETFYEFVYVTTDEAKRGVWYVLRMDLCGLRPPGSYREDW